MQGIILEKKYLLINKIGSGAYSDVYLAYNFIIHKCFAIKVQGADSIEEGEMEVEIFETVKKNKCEYVNNLVDSFIHESNEGDNVCMVFELMAGSTYDLIKSGKYCHGIPINILKKITIQIIDGIISLQKIKKIHTDIKPENVLIVGLNDKHILLIEKIKKFDFTKKNGENLSKIIKNRQNGKKNINLIQTEAIHNTCKALMEYLNCEKDEKCQEIEHKCNKFDQRNRSCYYHENEPFNHINLNNIVTKLSDMGSCKEINYKNHNIQTRYYRCPEVILEYTMNDKCDIWSLGCLIYELLTGEIMFEPDKQIGFNRNRHHINDIQKIFGPIPDEYINECHNKNIIFKNNNLLKNKISLKHIPLSKLLAHKLNSEYTESNDFYQLCDLLYNMFEYDINKRYTIEQCKEHPWLKNIT